MVRAGPDPTAYIFRTTLSDDIWPLHDKSISWTEGQLFDAIEFLYGHASGGSGGRYHSWSNCGDHFDTFDAARGRQHIRETLNPLLAGYDIGYELTQDGEVSELLAQHMSVLVETPLPTEVPQVVADAVRRAIELHRHRARMTKCAGTPRGSWPARSSTCGHSSRRSYTARTTA